MNCKDMAVEVSLLHCLRDYSNEERTDVLQNVGPNQVQIGSRSLTLLYIATWFFGTLTSTSLSSRLKKLDVSELQTIMPNQTDHTFYSTYLQG